MVVPCGKCELCLSHRRDNWSIRVQLHAAAYVRMPLFVTLTYDNENVPVGDEVLSLSRNDFNLFIKKYKDRYNLYNTSWSYFGCGEYGEMEGKTNRPHYHLIIFGDKILQEIYDADVWKAEDYVRDVWQKGIVHVCQAEWSGIHYVTKYVMKEDPDDWTGEAKEKPFVSCSQGIGMCWLTTGEAMWMKKQLERVSVWRDEYIKLFDELDIDVSDVSGTIKRLHAFFDRVPDYPDFRVTLPSGKRAFLPREIRRKLVGSFEHFKDSPLWLFEHCKNLLQSLEYYRDNGGYDETHEVPISLQENQQKVNKIRQCLIERKKRKQVYATV